MIHKGVIFGIQPLITFKCWNQVVKHHLQS